MTDKLTNPLQYSDNSKFDCVIFGGTTLPIRCGEILIRNGHQINAVVTTDVEFVKWSESEGITIFSNVADFVERIDQPFDYLFSIVNEHILNATIIELPRLLAINYHDAPLPRYAGTHATSWAIMNGETVHGVTWHVIDEKVDAGDILEQQSVRIDAEETALTLNSKCYEASLASFQRLISKLANGSIVRHKQDLSHRTFYPSLKRPPNGGVIQWYRSAAEISALVRALDFGPYTNQLGSPKLLIEDKLFIVKNIAVSNSISGSKPGEILDFRPGALKIATGDHDVILKEVLDMSGQPAEWFALNQEFQLERGSNLTNVNNQVLLQIESREKEIAQSEKYWINKFKSLIPTKYPSGEQGRQIEPNFQKIDIDLAAANIERLTELYGPASVVSAFLLLLSQISGSKSFDIDLSREEPGAPVNLRNWLCPSIPFRFAAELDEAVPDVMRRTVAEINRELQRPGFQSDIFYRYPHLRNLRLGASGFNLPVCVLFDQQGALPSFSTNFRLGLVISDAGRAASWICDLNSVDSGDIERLSRQLKGMIEAIVAHPDSLVSDLTAVASDELDRVLIEWNKTTREFATEKLIHRLISDQANSNPNSVALTSAANQISYKELDLLSNRLARRLRRESIGKESLVGVLMDRSVESVVAMLGILKSGAAYLPLDPTYPKERIEFMLRDADVRVLLTDPKYSVDFAKLGITTFDIDSGWQFCIDEDSTSPSDDSKPEDLAYVIYTSGSTGKPKGVEIEHRNLLNLVDWHRRTYDLSREDRTTLLAGPAFDASVWEIWPSLAAGATVFVPDDVTRTDPFRLASWMEEKCITVSFLPTPLAELVIEDSSRRFTQLRVLLTGGDRLHRVKCKLPYKFINHYGPTENTVVATAGTVNEDLGNLPSIGRPIQNVKVFLLGEDMKPVPIGSPGEIFIGGAGLARGYRKRPELTEERFPRISFGGFENLRLYRTGDIGKYRSDGSIDFIGRIDDQVKLRGFRIELGEIESTLLTFESIKECSVVVKESSTHDKRLVAYYVVSNGHQVDSKSLKHDLKNLLPEYMVPSIFIQLSTLPVTSNGKIDKKALLELSEIKHEHDLEPSGSETPAIRKLTEIWQRVLGIKGISTTDDFFELGGNSLSAVRIFAEIEDTFAKSIPLATLFEAGTIEKLASILEIDGWAPPESSLVPIQPNGKRPTFFCVHAKGGNVLFYKDLAARLGNDQPFYGIQARRLAGRQVGHESVEEMAAYYIKEIKSLQPKGPYYLGGSSFGGLAAFEIARQLSAAGDEIGLLALLDTGTPDYPIFLPSTTKFRSKVYEAVRRIQHHRDSLTQLEKQERFNYIKAKIGRVQLKYKRKFRNSYKKAVREFFTRFREESAIPSKYLQLEDKIWKAGQQYAPKYYAGKVTLFIASVQPLGIVADRSLGWDRFTDRLEIHEVPGHHGSIVKEPYVSVTAKKLRACIDRTLNDRQQTNHSFEQEASRQSRYDVAGV